MERQSADYEIDKIKSAVKESLLDYYINESPFGIFFSVKKCFLKDFSPKYTPINISTPFKPHESVNTASLNESGYFQNANDFSIHEDNLQETRGFK